VLFPINVHVLNTDFLFCHLYFNVELIAVISELIQGKTEFTATLTYRFSDGECDDDIEKDETAAYARIKQALFIKVSFITRTHTCTNRQTHIYNIYLLSKTSSIKRWQYYNYLTIVHIISVPMLFS